MKKRWSTSILVLGLLCNFLIAKSQPSIAPPLGYNWESVPEITDEFNGTSLDGAKWMNGHPYWAGRFPSKFVPENVSQADGNLLLKSTYNAASPGGSWVNASCVTSKTKAAAPGDYLEARIKCARLSMTTGFWFQEDVYPETEIDVIENYGEASNPTWSHLDYTPSFNTHYLFKQDNHPTTPGWYPVPGQLNADDYHVYAVWWKDKDTVVWYYDGLEVFKAKHEGEFNKNMYMFFDMEAFDWGVGLPTQEQLNNPEKNTAKIDWVRSWRLVAGPRRPVTSISASPTSLNIAIGERSTIAATVLPSNATDKSVTWSSSNTNVATVSSSGVVEAIGAGNATITASSNSQDGTRSATISVTVYRVAATAMRVEPTTLELREGLTSQLQAVFTPSNTSNKTVTWTSSNTGVVSVSSAGLVTAVSRGTATITGRSQDGGYTSTSAITVVANPQPNLVVNPGFETGSFTPWAGRGNVTIATNNASTGTHSVLVNGGTSGDAAVEQIITNLTPNTTYTLTCKAKVGSSGNSAKLGAKDFGSEVGVDITATSYTNTTVTFTTGSTNTSAKIYLYIPSAGNTVYGDDFSLTAPAVPVSGVTVSPTSVSLNTGESRQLTATVTPSNAGNNAVTWTSSNSNIASVTASGLVTAVSGGSATITAKTSDGNFTATCNVTVSVPNVAVTGATVTPSSSSNQVGQTVQLTAGVLPANASNKTVSWSSSNTAIATVNSSGLVTCIAAGNTTITVTTASGNFTATSNITVTPGIRVASISVSPVTLTREVGQTAQITATVLPANASNKNVTWVSGNTNAVSVDNNGLITALASGTSVITAKTIDGNFTATCAVTVPSIRVTSVTVSPTSITKKVGESEQLSVNILPANASDKSVVWSSSNTGVATVNSNGLVSANGDGSAIITAKTNDGNFTATCSITVQIGNLPQTESGKKWWIVRELSDEFNDTKLDETKWMPYHPYWIGRVSTFKPENVSVTGGNLNLKANVRYPGTCYNCDTLIDASCVTSNTKAMKPGFYSEARIKCAKDNMTSAYWFQGDYSEIDVIENFGGPKYEPLIAVQMRTNLHYFKGGWNLDIPTPWNVESRDVPGGISNIADNYHTYGVWWKNADTIVFYLDGLEVHTSKTGGAFNENMYMFFDRENFVQNGAAWPELADNKSTMLVDWVHTYKMDVDVPSVAVTGIQLLTADTISCLGDKFSIGAVVSPANATNKFIYWSSSDQTVATVDIHGVITILKESGSTTITARTDDGGKIATCTVRGGIIPLRGITIAQNNPRVGLGGFNKLSVITQPLNASNKNVTWSSSNPAVASIDSKGVVYGASLGTTTIKATSREGSFISQATLTVVSGGVPTGYVSMEEYDGIAGDKVSHLTSSPNYPDNPTITADYTSFEIGRVGENLGVRMRGLLTPPESGDYTFYVAGDDEAELWISSDINPENAVKIANTSVYTNYQEWTKSASQKSAKISLIAGKAYYIYGIYKQAAGGYNFSVGWQTPSQSAITVIPGSVMSPYYKFCPAVSGVTLPAAWSMNPGDKSTLSATFIPANACDKSVTWSSSNTAVATISNTGEITALNNYGTTVITVRTNDGAYTATCLVTVEQYTGCSASGLILMEKFDNITGSTIADLTSASVYPNSPTSQSQLTSFEAPSTVGDSYGLRVRGYICAPQNGSYTFWIAGDDHAELWLSTDSDPSNARKIAYETDWTESRAWNKFQTQKSVEIVLSKGKSYYIEALMKEKDGGDCLAVGWRKPNDGAGTVPSEVIPGSVLSSFVVGDPIAVTGVVVTPTSATLSSVGATQSLTATVSPENATNQRVIWSTSNAAVATVSTSGVVTAVANGMATITATTADGSKTATCAITVNIANVAVSGVTVSPSSVTLTSSGATRTLTATVSPSNATNQAVNWTSSNTAIATVSASGVVTAVSNGSATITATTVDGAKTATCAITVNISANVPVSSVTVAPTSATLTSTGATRTLTATVSPSNATNQAVNWTSSNTAIATVNASGVVTAVANGMATITATTVDGAKTATCAITVNISANVPVSSVTVVPSSFTLTSTGATRTLTATVSPSNASNQAVNWTSSNTAIATVNASGVVTAVANGMATITATTVDGAETATSNVTVNISTTESITADNMDFELGNLTSWSVTGNVSIVNSNDDIRNTHSGTYAAKIIGGSANIEQLLTGLSPNTTYILSAWVKKEAGECYLGVKNMGDNQITNIVSSVEWSKLTIKFTTGSNNNSAVIFLNVQNANHTCFADDFQVIRDFEKVSSVGIIDNKNSDESFSLDVYPNPASENVNIRMFLPEEQNVCVRILNSLGQSVYYSNFGSYISLFETSVEIQMLLPDLYYVVIVTDNNRFVKKLIVK